MAEKVVIEIYKNKNPDELTKLIADPDSKLETGSAAAVTGAVAAALLSRAAAIAIGKNQDKERLEYILRNAEIIRNYMVHLIDEDVKSRGPLNRAMKEGGPREIEAARHPAVAICSEIVNMMGKCLELLSELVDICPEEGLHYILESGETAMAAIKSAVSYVLDMTGKCSDETYRFVTRRENEITMEQYAPMYQKILEKAQR